MTLQHFVHEPQDFPGAKDGFEAAFQSSPKNSDAAGAAGPARPAFLRFASPILMLPTVEGRLSEGSIELPVPLHKDFDQTGRAPTPLF